jgi:hypothetical protein
MQTADMEDWEIDLLCSAYDTETEKSRILEGNLYDYMEETLEHIRTVNSYLKEKYPEASFEITGVELSGMTVENESYEFSVEGADENSYAIIYESGECRDNYYRLLLEPEYDAELVRRLGKSGISAVTVFTDFPSAQGEEVDGNLSAEDIISAGSKIQRDTAIYINSTDCGMGTEAIKEAVTALNIYGSYRIYYSDIFESGMDAETCQNRWLQNKDRVDTISFQVK